MGGTMTKVLPGLYIGGLESAKNEEQLIANCISHILVVQTTNKELEDKSPSREYLHTCITERDCRSLIRRIPETNTFIHRARSESGNVLVCSESGISTNSAIVAAYLMTVYSLDSRSAVCAVQGLRHVALPIPSLLTQLDRFGGGGGGGEPGQPPRESNSCSSTSRGTTDTLINVAAERQRIKETFGDWAAYEEDIEQLHNAIRSFKSLSDSGILLRDSISPLPEMWPVTSSADFEASSYGLVSYRLTDSSHSTLELHPSRSTTTATTTATAAVPCKGLARSKAVKLTPPSTPPSTPVCFPSGESFIERAKNLTSRSSGPTAVTDAGDLSELAADFLNVRDCSPPATLNETDLFPGDAPIIGIDGFAEQYCQKVAEQSDSAEPADAETGPAAGWSAQSSARYEIGVEVSGDAETEANCEEEEDEEDDDIPGAIDIRTGRPVAIRLSAPRTAASYQTGLASPRHRLFTGQQDTSTAANTPPPPIEAPRASEPALAGRLSTTMPAVRSFIPFFWS